MQFLPRLKGKDRRVAYTQGRRLIGKQQVSIQQAFFVAHYLTVSDLTYCAHPTATVGRIESLSNVVQKRKEAKSDINWKKAVPLFPKSLSYFPTHPPTLVLQYEYEHHLTSLV